MQMLSMVCSDNEEQLIRIFKEGENYTLISCFGTFPIIQICHLFSDTLQLMTSADECGIYIITGTFVYAEYIYNFSQEDFIKIKNFLMQ